MPTSERPLFSFRMADEPSFLAFIVQQLFVPAGSVLIFLLVPGVPWTVVQAGVIGQLIEVSRSLLLCSATGWVLGSAARRIFPSASSSGKWIGVLPSIL